MLDKARRIAEKYIADNPDEGLCLRPYLDRGIKRGSDYRYAADFNTLFPEAKIGDKAFVRCVYKAPCDEKLGMKLTLFGSAELSVNGKQIFKSSIFNERCRESDILLDVFMAQGENLLELVFTKTALGFGGIFGTHIAKWDYIFFRPDDVNIEGCVYRLNGGKWQPELFEEEKTEEISLFLAERGGKRVFKSGRDFPEDEGYKNAAGVEGYGAWLRNPGFGDCAEADFTKLCNGTYWRFKYKDMWLRPYYKSSNFGKWNYPLGVTLYGLLRIGQLLEDKSIIDYAKNHVKRCIDTFDYALWDKESHGGAASLHNLLCSIDSLDDCGAFASVTEEMKISLGLEGTEKICAYVSDYIETRQPRRADGAFYRDNQLHSLHNGTMWLDDLYMSVPFLCRRYVITGEERFLDDAANQFLQYKKYLYMENKNLMSHVYDFKNGLRNGVAWGRGNGWFVFSLSEWLMTAPASHRKRRGIEDFFVTLCRGYAMRQSADGRWHQVLDEEDSYLETSCTAMFACAFMRGFRMGLLGEEYREKATKAVRSISDRAVDENGNLFGVCRGSEFSFSSDYYKNLLPRTNDTHGIGIVLLAIYEVTT